MNNQNQKAQNLGRGVVVVTLLVFLATSSMLAISSDDGPHRRRNPERDSRIRAMDAFARRYGGADWSIVGSALADHPGNASNPRIMSVFLSLGNVYLNRFEQHGAGADLDRSLAFFEAVAGNEQLWGKRPIAGAVVAYLGISLVRLEAECGVGGYQGRVEDLRRKVTEISAEEADAIAQAEEYAEEFVATTPEEDATRAALYAAAATLLPEDSRAQMWGYYVRSLAIRLSSLDARTAETALVYEISGKEIPRELERFASAMSSRQSPRLVEFRDEEITILIKDFSSG